MGNGLVVLTGRAHALYGLDRSRNRLVDAALQVHGVHAGGYRLQSFVDDGLGQYGGGGGTVTRGVRGLGSNFLDHLCTHVFKLVLEFDLFGDRYSVLGYGGCTKGFLEDDVAALGPQSSLHGVGEDIHAIKHLPAGGVAKMYVFSCHFQFLSIKFGVGVYSTTA